MYDTLESIPRDKPLTHADYIRACVLMARARVGIKPHLQIQKRIAGRTETLCAQATELDAGRVSGEWFKVTTAIGDFWVESRFVRLCSGDGRCTCEGCPQEGPRTGHRYPVRDGLTGNRAEGKNTSSADACKNLPVRPVPAEIQPC